MFGLYLGMGSVYDLFKVFYFELLDILFERVLFYLCNENFGGILSFNWWMLILVSKYIIFIGFLSWWYI